MPLTQVSGGGLADDSVSAAKIATGAVTAADIPDGEITNAKIGDGEIQGGKLHSTIDLPDAATAHTQTAGTNNTTIATTAYVDTAVGNLSQDSMTEGNTKAEVVDTGTDGHFLVETEGIERLRVIANGRVGIGTATPSCELDINGTGAIEIPGGTTEERPLTSTNGMIRYNSSLDVIEEHRGGNWHNLSNPATVSGGTKTEVGGDTVHTFTSSGTLTVSGSSVTGVSILVVAGGGGGGHTRAGGGGAGGMVVLTNQTLPVGSHTITVGAGGSGSTTNVANGTAGSNSVVGSIQTATGGGFGAGEGKNGGDGGSGGGGSDGGSAGSGTSGQGNDGGNSTGSTGGGGGGGKGAVGTTPSNTSGGAGGGGQDNNFRTGSNITYAGGGGGGSRDGASGGSGGSGGGGNGGINASTPSTAGSANTGGGGGGGGRVFGDNMDGANGGSGIVVIRYASL